MLTHPKEAPVSEETTHPDAVCMASNLPCGDLSEALIERDTLRARVAELEILLEQKVRCQCGDDEACAHVRRVAELEAAVRTLHALAEPHFGEGTIDVPAMPELNRK